MSERAPFITLGKHLKYVREQLHQSVAEVSGAVEIDSDMLEQIEAGRQRPTEDILLLLISHYGVQEQQAVQLWELAEYDDTVPEQLRPEIEVPAGQKIVMLLAMDTRTMYSDGVEVDVDKAGITLTFTQASGKSGKTPVARVGMSSDQAVEVMRAMQRAMLKAKYAAHPKLLPPTGSKD